MRDSATIARRRLFAAVAGDISPRGWCKLYEAAT